MKIKVGHIKIYYIEIGFNFVELKIIFLKLLDFYG
jgi:hypothetical protein